MAEQQQDVDALKRRARRRLVGAVALVLAAVIVLPMMFDPEPRSSAPPISVRIPGEDDTPFKPKLPAKAPEPAKLEPKLEPKPEPQKPQESSDKKEAARAEAALKGEQYFVPVGAYADPSSVIAKLAEAKLPYFTEDLAVKGGKVTRVRAGPFASKEAAEKAVVQLKGLGLQPGKAAAKT